MAIISTQHREVYSNTSSSKSMVIKADGKAFKVFFSGMYSNKPESITREIWSNAFDAHIDNGCADKPFDVVFPSRFSPTFTVRDYGKGLSKDFMMNGYCMVFHSEKDNSNEQVGGFGVGRLSPFSYKDSYSVTSWHQGMKSIYSCYLDSKGIPTISLLYEEKSNEPSGIEVSFPINSSDIYLFEAAAKRVSLGFDVKPNVIGNPNFNWPELEVLTKGDGYTYYRRHPLLNNSGYYAKMGCVIYPIPSANVGNIVGFNNLGNLIIFDFEIGSLQPTVSREELSFGLDEPTEASINKVLAKFKANIEKDFKEQLDKIPDLYSKYRFSVTSGMKFDSSSLAKELNEHSIYLQVIDKYRTRINTSKLSTYNTSTFSRYVYNATEKVYFFIYQTFDGMDSKKDTYLHGRVLNYIKSNSLEYTDCYIYTYSDPAQEKSLKKFLTDVPKDSIVWVSSLPDPPKVPRGTTKPVKIYQYNPSSSNYSSRTLLAYELQEVTVSIITPELNYIKSENSNTKVSHGQIKVLLNLGLIKEPIYVVPKTNWPKFKKAKDIKEIWDALDKDKYTKHGEKYVEYSSEDYIPIVGNCNLLKQLKETKDRSNELLDRLTTRECASVFPGNYLQTSTYLQLVRDIKDKYPLLSNISNKKHLENYILMVQKENQNGI